MIGGYFYYKEFNRELDQKINNITGEQSKKITLSENGYMFYKKDFKSKESLFFETNDMVILSNDILAGKNLDNEYHELNIEKEFYPFVKSSSL